MSPKSKRKLKRDLINKTVGDLTQHLFDLLYDPDMSPDLASTLWLMIDNLESAQTRLLHDIDGRSLPPSIPPINENKQ